MTLKYPGKEDEHEESIPGLNWTRQCLDSVLKYPWGFDENPDNRKKWGLYDSEREIFDWVRKDRPKFRKSLGAEIIDWADDITYAIHDLLDFFRAGKIPIDRLKADRNERLKFLNGIFHRNSEWKNRESEWSDALSNLIADFPFYPERRFRDSGEDHSRLQLFATSLIRPFVQAIRYVPDAKPEAPIVQIDRLARRQVDLLKQFTWHYIILNRDLALPQAGQRKAVRVVFRKLLLAARKRDFHLFPEAVQGSLQAGELEALYGGKRAEIRIVSDYIAGMTEKEVMRVFWAIEAHG